MLLSAREERARRFKLALRAGIPILLLFFLLFFAIFSKGGLNELTVENAFLMGGLVFITVYFIYFLLELDVKETLLDQATESFNYLTFLDKLRTNKPRTVALLVINNLSTINEHYGTQASNELLHTLVLRLNQCAQTHDINTSWIGRHYGAEFLIAIDIESTEVKKMLEQFTKDNQVIDTIEVDYRFAVISYQDIDPEKIISLLKDEIASQECSPSKPKETIKSVNELSKMERETVQALENEAIALYFRPLYNVHRKEIDSYEVAVKLKNPYGKEILPRDYLPIVNRLGMGRTYDLAIFKHLVEVAALCDETISFSFNLSPFSLRNHHFLEEIYTIVQEKGIAPKRLIIELYERKTPHNLSGYLKTLGDLRARGFQICIDNFGSSNASMEYIKHFTFHRVQFDRDFVTKLDDRGSLLVFKSLIDMSKAMHITTVAKWVDKEEQKQRLIELGIDYLQGFGVGKYLNESQLIKTFNT
jgi:EAL domain-containing protein (putative c-di-GMP-specific phosphodiesterase class I)/GGDEF domain-containing protein